MTILSQASAAKKTKWMRGFTLLVVSKWYHGSEGVKVRILRNRDNMWPKQINNSGSSSNNIKAKNGNWGEKFWHTDNDTTKAKRDGDCGITSSVPTICIRLTSPQQRAVLLLFDLFSFLSLLSFLLFVYSQFILSFFYFSCNEALGTQTLKEQALSIQDEFLFFKIKFKGAF